MKWRTWKGAGAVKSDDSTFGYVSVNALMEFAKNHVDGKVDCNDIARFPRANVRNADEQQSLQQIFEISYSRLRELAEAEKDGRLVVLPVAEGGTAATPDGDAILNSWDIVARVTFCNEKRSHVYWKDKYADFDISDIKSKE